MSKYLKLLNSAKIITKNKIYNMWYNELESFIKFVKQDDDFDEDTIMFKSELLEKYDLETLIELFDFGTENKIEMFQRTVVNAILNTNRLFFINGKKYLSNINQNVLTSKNKHYLQLYEFPERIYKFVTCRKMVDLRNVYYDEYYDKKNLSDTILNKLYDIFTNMFRNSKYEVVGNYIKKFITKPISYEYDLDFEDEPDPEYFTREYKNGLITESYDLTLAMCKKEYNLDFDRFVNIYVGDKELQRIIQLIN